MQANNSTNEHPAQSHTVMLALLICAAFLAVFTFVTFAVLIGFVKTFIAYVVLACIAIGAHQFKVWQHHRHDIADRIHHRKMLEKAIDLGHSVEHNAVTRQLRTISPWTVPSSPITIRDNQFGQAQLTAGNAEQPRLETIIDELSPNALEFAFGSNRETGQIVKNTLPKAVHLQAIGSTGFGKSMQATGILTQLCTRNDPDHLQLALIDCEGETTAPFADLPHVRFAAEEPREAAKVLAALCKELERRHISKQDLPMILIFVEEFLTLRNRMPASLKNQALYDFTELACGGRKHGLSLFTIGQTAYAEKSIRDAQNQFFSSMCFSAKPDMARAAGFRNTALLNTLYSEKRKGQFLLEASSGDAILLAPHVNMRQVKQLLGSSWGSSRGTSEGSSEQDTDELPLSSGLKHAEVPQDSLSLSAQERHVLECLRAGYSQNRMMADVYGIDKPGAEYQKMLPELRAAMQRIALLAYANGK